MFFERYCWAPMLDACMRSKDVMKQRELVIPRASGRVLEIGAGSGLNFALYAPERVKKVWALDPSETLFERARGRIGAVAVELTVGSAEAVPFDAASFDTVVSTWTLCSIPHPARALGEIRRVLAPGGKLLFAEHGLARDAGVARWQNRVNPLWVRLSGGCNMNRPIAPLIEDSGFRFDAVESAFLPGFKLLTFNTWGAALPA